MLVVPQKCSLHILVLFKKTNCLFSYKVTVLDLHSLSCILTLSINCAKSVKDPDLGPDLRVKNQVEGLQKLFQHFDARCLSVACSSPTKQYELLIFLTKSDFMQLQNKFLFIYYKKILIKTAVRKKLTFRSKHSEAFLVIEKQMIL